MRFLWLISLFFPSLVFAAYGCPEGYNSGMVTMSTNLPICVKYGASQLGGCEVNCKGVCVQYPLKDSQGPVYTTGVACKPSDGGGGGKPDPDPENPDPENPDPENPEGGGKPNPNWNFFEAPTGDVNGTSISDSIAKLNRNLGLTVGSGLNGMTYNRVNEIKGDTNRIVNASEAAQQSLKEISEYNRVANHKLEGMELIASRSENYLEQIAKKGGGDSGSGGSSDMEAFLKPKFDELFGKFDRDYYGAQMNVSNNTGSMLSHVAGIHGALGMNGMAGQIKQMNESMQHLADVMINGAGSGGGSGGGDGKGIDYSKMPGSDGNPLSVKRGQYNSKCEGGDCFFDVAGINKELEKANKSLTDKHADIAKEVKDIFSFSLSGSAEVMDCFELFSYGGKTYQVCPPSQDYWQSLAALMMFIFYFIALMVIFKR